MIIIIIIIEHVNPAQRVYGSRPSASLGESPDAESCQEDRSYAGRADSDAASSSPDRRCRGKKVRGNGRDHRGGSWMRRD